MKIENQEKIISQISAALSMTGIQHNVIANNIANAGLPSFSRQIVSFDAGTISHAAREKMGSRTPMASIIASRANFVTAPDSPGTGIEADMMDLSVNTLRFTTLSKVLSRYFAIAAAIASANRI